MLLLLYIALTVRVHTDGNCPSASQVEERLDALGVVGPERDAGEARIESDRDGLRLSLRDSAGTVLAQRRLPGGADCPALAEAAALVIVSWLSLPASSPMIVSVLPPEPLNAIRPAGSPWRFEVGAGVSASWTPSPATMTGLAPAGLLLGAMGRNWWTLRLSLGYDGPRQMALPPGDVQWQRGLLGLGASARLPLGNRLRFEVGLDALLSELFLQGQDFTSDLPATSLDPGVDLNARVTFFAHGPLRLWACLWLFGWLRQEVPQVRSVANTTALPDFAAAAGLGLSFEKLVRF